MVKNILIVEDNKAHLRAVQECVDELGRKIKIFTAANHHDAFIILMEHHIHLFLIDIILNPKDPGDVSGLNLVRELRGISKYAYTPVIFITSLEDPKLYSYSLLHCRGYIEKPFNKERVQECVSEALDFPVLAENKRTVYFRKDGVIYAKKVNDIIYIENIRHKIVIHCVNDELEVPYKSCEKILDELASDSFIQCSRYAIINKQYIDLIDYPNRFIKIKNKDIYIEIGAIMKKKFRSEMEDERYIR